MSDADISGVHAGCRSFSLSHKKAKDLRQRFDSLGVHYKTVLIMYAHGWSVKKIAARLRNTTNLVKKYLRRAAEAMDVSLKQSKRLPTLIAVLAGMGCLHPYRFSASSDTNKKKESIASCLVPRDGSLVDVAKRVLRENGRPMALSEMAYVILGNRMWWKIKRMRLRTTQNPRVRRRFLKSFTNAMIARRSEFVKIGPRSWWLPDEHKK